MKRTANSVENRFKQFSSKLTARADYKFNDIKNVSPSLNRFKSFWLVELHN